MIPCGKRNDKMIVVNSTKHQFYYCETHAFFIFFFSQTINHRSLSLCSFGVILYNLFHSRCSVFWLMMCLLDREYPPLLEYSIIKIKMKLKLRIIFTKLFWRLRNFYQFFNLILNISIYQCQLFIEFCLY